MKGALASLFLVLALAGVGLFRTWQARKDGKTQEKLKSAEGALNEIDKGNRAVARARADDRLSDRLRKRYGSKHVLPSDRSGESDND